MTTVNLIPPFDSPLLFANPYLLPILSAALGDDYVVGAYGAVCSLPSAAAQHRHADGGLLFRSTGVDWLLPPAAITVVIPLIEMNEIHGTTTLWLGSHRDQKRYNALLDPNSSADFTDAASTPWCARAHACFGISVWYTAAQRIEARYRVQCCF
jgi:ectoine hydroxylase-related dioxygenase (phytanoyl-CoA dioxygenase family)